MKQLKTYSIVLVFWLISQTVFGQELDSVNVSVDFKETPIEDALKSLEKEYAVSFSFKQEWLGTQKITVKEENQPLTKVLKQMLQPCALSYVVFQDQVILLPKSEVAYIMGDMIDTRTVEKQSTSIITIGDRSQAGKYKSVSLSGVVVDGATREPLTGATILVENTNNYSVSGYSGDYKLKLTPGEYVLSASCIGFENKKLEIEIISPGDMQIELFEKTHEISEVVISAQKADDNIRSNQMSVVQLDAKTIKQLPSIVGDKDVIKSLTMMPGVKSVGEFGSGINVRGGGEDQNLYLVEGAPVFNTSHVMGLLSVINPDAVTGVTLYKGHIPANYGERVSSVMDIQLQDHNIDKFTVKGGIGLYNSRLMVETATRDKKVSFKVGGRASYSDVLLRQMPDYYLKNSSAQFYDLTSVLKLSFKKDLIKLFAYYSNDYFKYAQNFQYNYGNVLSSADWTHIFNPNLSSSVTLSYSTYEVQNDDYQEELSQASTLSGISYLAGKAEVSYTGINKHSFLAGFQGTNYNVQPGERTPIGTSKLSYSKVDPEQGNEFAIFLNDVYEVNSQVSIQAGLRYSFYNYLGPGTVYDYNNEGSTINVIDSTQYGEGEKIVGYGHLEPRLSAKIVLDESSSLKISYNRNVQYLSLLSYSSISTPEDVWKLSDPYLQPLKADQFALGYYRNFLNNQIETSAEVYYKQLSNMLEYKNGAQLAMNNQVEKELLNADGYNYGIELLLKKSTGKVNGWVSYTYSRSLKQTTTAEPEYGINSNDIYPSPYDKPHDLTVYLNYQASKRLRFGCNFALASGRPITLPEYVIKSGTHELVYYSDRNKYRLPTYHRLDVFISLDESLKKNKKWKGSWTLSVLNVYGRKNAYTVYYKQEDPSVLNDFQLFSLYKLYLIGIPLPTITYNFVF